MREQIIHSLGTLQDGQLSLDSGQCLFCGIHLDHVVDEVPIYQRPSMVDIMVLTELLGV